MKSFPLAKLFGKYVRRSELRLPDALKTFAKNFGIAILMILALDLVAILFLFLVAHEG